MKYLRLFSFLILAALLGPNESIAQEGRLGEVRMFAGDFAPAGWKMCDGQLMAIASNGPLYAIIGNTFGGDGRTTFALPDLRGRSVVGSSPQSKPGATTGQPYITIERINMPEVVVPVHSAGVNDPLESGHKAMLSSDLQPNTHISLNGSSDNDPLSVYQPYTGINYIICVDGLLYSSK